MLAQAEAADPWCIEDTEYDGAHWRVAHLETPVPVGWDHINDRMPVLVKAVSGQRPHHDLLKYWPTMKMEVAEVTFLSGQRLGGHVLALYFWQDEPYSPFSIDGLMRQPGTNLGIPFPAERLTSVRRTGEPRVQWYAHNSAEADKPQRFDLLPNHFGIFNMAVRAGFVHWRREVTERRRGA